MALASPTSSVCGLCPPSSECPPPISWRSTCVSRVAAIRARLVYDPAIRIRQLGTMPIGLPTIAGAWPHQSKSEGSQSGRANRFLKPADSFARSRQPGNTSQPPRRHYGAGEVGPVLRSLASTTAGGTSDIHQTTHHHHHRLEPLCNADALDG